MARVTATEVKAIMNNCVVLDATVETFIIASDALITKVFDGDTEVSDELLKEIERWFTAHMLASTLHRMASRQKVDDAEIQYTGKWDINLMSTPYGQMVAQLDISGKMANMGKPAARMYAIKSFDS